MSRAVTDDEIRRALDRWEIGVGAPEPHEELGWTREEYQHWIKTKEIPVEEDQSVAIGSFLPPEIDKIVQEIKETSIVAVPCDGSGGFGPPPDSGLVGWLACPGCENCKPPPGTLDSVKADVLPTEIKSPERTWVPSDDSPVPSDRLPRKKKRRVDRAKLDTFIKEMPRWHVQLDGDDWTVRCDVHGLADEPNTFGGDVRKAMERADSLNREYQMRYINSLDEEES